MPLVIQWLGMSFSLMASEGHPSAISFQRTCRIRKRRATRNSTHIAGPEGGTSSDGHPAKGKTEACSEEGARTGARTKEGDPCMFLCFDMFFESVSV